MDALGNPIRFTITPGQAGDCPPACGLVDGLTGVGHVIADAAYDADHFRALGQHGLGAEAQIPSNPSRTKALPLDRELYNERHLVENFVLKIKRFRRIALRCEKTLSSFRAFVALACAMVWIA